MRRFIMLLQFLTRIPINIDLGFDEDFHKTIVYFPLVGLVIGTLLYLVGIISSFIFEPFIVSIVVTLSSVIITGGLHIDGLGDTFDAIYSNRDKDKMLEIMKDSRLGTNSLLAILFLVLVKVGFISSLISKDLLWGVIFMPMIARLGVLFMMYKTVTPRKTGMGNLFIGKATLSMIIISITYSITSIFVIGKIFFMISNVELLKILLSILIVIIFVCDFKKKIYKKIDGVTGDILGCSIELSEVIFLIVIYLLLVI